MEASEPIVSETKDWSYLDEMTQAAVVIDPELRYLYANDAAAIQAGKPKEAMVGKTLDELFPTAKEQEVFIALQKALKNRDTTQAEMSFRGEDDAVQWFQVRMEPIPEGVLVVTLDITKFKKLQSSTK